MLCEMLVYFLCKIDAALPLALVLRSSESCRAIRDAMRDESLWEQFLCHDFPYYDSPAVSRVMVAEVTAEAEAEEFRRRVAAETAAEDARSWCAKYPWYSRYKRQVRRCVKLFVNAKHIVHHCSCVTLGAYALQSMPSG